MMCPHRAWMIALSVLMAGGGLVLEVLTQTGYAAAMGILAALAVYLGLQRFHDHASWRKAFARLGWNLAAGYALLMLVGLLALAGYGLIHMQPILGFGMVVCGAMLWGLYRWAYGPDFLLQAFAFLQHPQTLPQSFAQRMWQILIFPWIWARSVRDTVHQDISTHPF